MAFAAGVLTDDDLARFAAAETDLTKALSRDPNHAVAHLFLGAVKMYTNRAAQGIAECEHALALDRNLAAAHGLIGNAKYLSGRGEETEAHMNEALRLSPRDTFAFIWISEVGLSKAQLGADTDAVSWLRRSLEANRNYPVAHFHLASALVRLGELDAARASVQAGLALDPSFTIRRFSRTNARSDNPIFLAGRERTLEGMRLAGVPGG